MPQHKPTSATKTDHDCIRTLIKFVSTETLHTESEADVRAQLAARLATGYEVVRNTNRSQTTSSPLKDSALYHMAFNEHIETLTLLLTQFDDKALAVVASVIANNHRLLLALLEDFPDYHDIACIFAGYCNRLALFKMLPSNQAVVEKALFSYGEILRNPAQSKHVFSQDSEQLHIILRLAIVGGHENICVQLFDYQSDVIDSREIVSFLVDYQRVKFIDHVLEKLSDPTTFAHRLTYFCGFHGNIDLFTRFSDYCCDERCLAPSTLFTYFALGLAANNDVVTLRPYVAKRRNLLETMADYAVTNGIVAAAETVLALGYSVDKLLQRITEQDTFLSNELKMRLLGKNLLPNTLAKFEKIPTPSIAFTSIDQSTLMVLTEVSHQTRGDYYAASRLIKALTQHCPKLNVHWMIMEKNRQVPADNIFCNRRTLLQSWEDLLNDANYRAVTCAKRVIIFPTFHFLSADIIKKLDSIRSKQDRSRIEAILEYDYIHKTDQPIHALKPGLLDDALGIFIDPPQVTGMDAAMALKMSKLGDLLFANAQPVHYHQNNTCFIGYRNKDLAATDNHLNSYYFVKLIFQLQQQRQDTRAIDVVTPLCGMEKAGIRQFFLQNLPWVESVVMYQRGHEQPEFGVKGSGIIQIRIIDAFPLANQTLRQLQTFAEPLQLCTGDQSLSEVISTPGKLPLYQVMVWKCYLLNGLLQRVQHSCTEKSALYRFFEASNTSMLNGYESLLAILVSDYDRLLTDMEVLRAHIIDRYNLYTTLPKQLNISHHG